VATAREGPAGTLRVETDGPPLEVAARFGRDDLEEVFLHLASERQASEHTEGLRP
jgi:hypothetical protein